VPDKVFVFFVTAVKTSCVRPAARDRLSWRTTSLKRTSSAGDRLSTMAPLRLLALLQTTLARAERNADC